MKNYIIYNWQNRLYMDTFKSTKRDLRDFDVIAFKTNCITKLLLENNSLTRKYTKEIYEMVGIK